MTDPSSQAEGEEERRRKALLLLLLALLLLICLLTTGMGDTFGRLGLPISSPRSGGEPATPPPPGSGTIEVAEGGLPYTMTGSVSQKLRPDGPASPIEITFENSDRGSIILVSRITVSIASVTGGEPGPNTCTAADFTLTQIRATAYPFSLPFGKSTLASLIGADSVATLRMVDRADVGQGDDTGNQDACKGATVHLTFRGAP